MKQEYSYDDFKYCDNSKDRYFAPCKKHCHYGSNDKCHDHVCCDKEWDSCGQKISCGEFCCQKESCISNNIFTRLRVLFSSCLYKSCQSLHLKNLEICPMGEFKPPFCVKRVAIGDCDVYKVSDWKVVPGCKHKGKDDIMFTLHLPIQLDVKDACDHCFTITGIACVPLCISMHVPCNLKPCDFEVRPLLKCANATVSCLHEVCVTAQFDVCVNTFHERLVCLQQANCCFSCPSVPIRFCD